jgi:hypothetical protein
MQKRTPKMESGGSKEFLASSGVPVLFSSRD